MPFKDLPEGQTHSDIKHNPMPLEKQVCSDCGKQDDTVRERACGYAEEVNNNPNCMEVVCDACENEHLMDI